MLPGMRLWKKKRRLLLKIRNLKRNSNNTKEHTLLWSLITTITGLHLISFSNASTQTTATTTTNEKSVSQVAFNCLICGKSFADSNHLKKHSEADHKLLLDIEKLTDPNEEDSTSRFLNSFIVDPAYINERKKCFPEHWDHICEWIRIRTRKSSWQWDGLVEYRVISLTIFSTHML